MKQTLQNLMKQAKKTMEPSQEQRLTARLPIAVVEHLHHRQASDEWYGLAYCGIIAAIELTAGLVLGTREARVMFTTWALLSVLATLPVGTYLCMLQAKARRRRFLIAYGLLHDPPAPPSPSEDMVRA